MGNQDNTSASNGINKASLPASIIAMSKAATGLMNKEVGTILVDEIQKYHKTLGDLVVSFLCLLHL